MSKLYGADGRLITKAQTPNFDPSFLMGFMQRMSAQGASNLTASLAEPYQNYIWVYACAGMASTSLCRLPSGLYDVKDENKVTFEDPVLDLFSRPNTLMTGSQFLEAIYLNLLLPTKRTKGGQCFLIANNEKGGKKTDFSRGEVPDEIYPFSDEFVFPIVKNGNLIGWELKLKDSETLTFEPHEIVRIFLYNPSSVLQGLSPFNAASHAVESDLRASELQSKFSKNNANLGGLLTTNEMLNKASADDLRTEWATKYEGLGNAGRTAILHSGINYQATSKSLVDLQFVEGKRLNREEILAAYRTSPVVLGITNEQGLNYATAQVAMTGYWNMTLIPLMDRVWESINTQWFGFLNKGRQAGFSDTSKVEALRQDYTAKLAIASVMIGHGVPVAQVYATLDIPLDVEGNEHLLRPLVIGSRVDLSTGEIVGAPVFNPSPYGAVDPTQPPENKGHNLDFVVKEASSIKLEEKRAKIWTDWVTKTVVPSEKRMQATLYKYFTLQRNSALDRIDDWAKTTTELKMVKAFDLSEIFSLSLSEWNKILKDMAYPVYDAGITVQAAQVADELGGTLVNWGQNAPYVEAYKAARIKFMQQINTTTFELARKEIADVISKATLEKLSVNETAKILKANIQDIYGVRLNNSNTIARTEMGSIASTTRFSIFRKEGITHHEWLSAKDEKVRDSHQADDGKTVVVGDKFPNTGVTYPGQIGGEAAEVINCRCVVLPSKGV